MDLDTFWKVALGIGGLSLTVGGLIFAFGEWRGGDRVSMKELGTKVVEQGQRQSALMTEVQSLRETVAAFRQQLTDINERSIRTHEKANEAQERIIDYANEARKALTAGYPTREEITPQFEEVRRRLDRLENDSARP